MWLFFAANFLGFYFGDFEGVAELDGRFLSGSKTAITQELAWSGERSLRIDVPADSMGTWDSVALQPPAARKLGVQFPAGTTLLVVGYFRPEVMDPAVVWEFQLAGQGLAKSRQFTFQQSSEWQLVAFEIETEGTTLAMQSEARLSLAWRHTTFLSEPPKLYIDNLMLIDQGASASEGTPGTQGNSLVSK